MAITFLVREDRERPGLQVVDILMDEQVVATMYPDDENSVKVVSPHFARFNVAGEISFEIEDLEGGNNHVKIIFKNTIFVFETKGSTDRPN